MHWITSVTLNINSQSTLYTVSTCPRRLNLCSIPQPGIFEIQAILGWKSENRKCTEWPQTDLEHLTVKYPEYSKYLPLKNKLSIFWSICMTSHFQDTWSKMRKCTEWPSSDEYLTVKRTHYTLRPECLGSISFYHQPVLRYKVDDQKTGNAPNDLTDLEHLTVKNTLYTVSALQRGTNFGLFQSMTSHYQDIRLLKIGNAPNDLKLNLNINGQFSDQYTASA